MPLRFMYSTDVEGLTRQLFSRVYIVSAVNHVLGRPILAQCVLCERGTPPLDSRSLKQPT